MGWVFFKIFYTFYWYLWFIGILYSLFLFCVSIVNSLISQIEELVVVNLDEGVIQFSSSVEMTALPKYPATVFKDSVKKFMSPLDVWQLEMYVRRFCVVETSLIVIALCSAELYCSVTMCEQFA